jgi:hypothetical protein
VSDKDGSTNPIPGDSGKSSANPADVERNKASPASRTKDLFIGTILPTDHIHRQNSSAKYPGGRIGALSIPILPTDNIHGKALFSKELPGRGESEHYSNPVARMAYSPSRQQRCLIGARFAIFDRSGCILR